MDTAEDCTREERRKRKKRRRRRKRKRKGKREEEGGGGGEGGGGRRGKRRRERTKVYLSNRKRVRTSFIFRSKLTPKATQVLKGRKKTQLETNYHN